MGCVRPSRLVTPRPWASGVAFVFLVVGGVLAYLLYRLNRLAKASQGSAHEVVLTGADMWLLGGGAAICWLVAAVLLWWQRRRVKAGSPKH